MILDPKILIKMAINGLNGYTFFLFTNNFAVLRVHIIEVIYYVVGTHYKHLAGVGGDCRK